MAGPMSPKTRYVLLTGAPGCGKTTAVQRVIELLDGLQLAGFYTREIRQHGRRVGFEAVGLNGGSVVLAHHDFRSKIRVGRYGLKLNEFDDLIESEFDRSPEEAAGLLRLSGGKRRRKSRRTPRQAAAGITRQCRVDLFVIDEIGKMECYSARFEETVRRLLAGTTPVLATVARRGRGLIGEVRRRPDVELITLTSDNRDQLPQRLAERFRDH